jgi:hypothetical protein
MKNLSTDQKKEKLKKLKKLISESWKLTNDLIGAEETHSRNQDIIYPIRTDLGVMKMRLDSVKYG